METNLNTNSDELVMLSDWSLDSNRHLVFYQVSDDPGWIQSRVIVLFKIVLHQRIWFSKNFDGNTIYRTGYRALIILSEKDYESVLAASNRLQ